MNEFDIKIIQRKLRTCVMIWFSFIVSILIYAGIVEWMQRGATEFVTAQNNSLHPILLVMTAICFLAAGISKYFLLRIPAERINLDTETLAGRLVTASMVSLALSEAICLMGFAEYFILHSYDSFYLFFIVAMVGMIVHMPRYPKWKSYLEQMTGTTLPEELQ
jgi:hypothetical protein